MVALDTKFALVAGAVGSVIFAAMTGIFLEMGFEKVAAGFFGSMYISTGIMITAYLALPNRPGPIHQRLLDSKKREMGGSAQGR